MAASASSAARNRSTRSPSGRASAGRAKRAGPGYAPAAAARLARASRLVQRITLCITCSGDGRRQTDDEERFVLYVRLSAGGQRPRGARAGRRARPSLVARPGVEQATYRRAPVRKVPATGPGATEVPVVSSGSYKSGRTALRHLRLTAA